MIKKILIYIFFVTFLFFIFFLQYQKIATLQHNVDELESRIYDLEDRLDYNK